MRISGRTVIWSAAAIFILTWAVPVWGVVLGFNEGPREVAWYEAPVDAVWALAIVVPFHLGLLLAPVVRDRRAFFRVAATLLMTPALFLGAWTFTGTVAEIGRARFWPIALVDMLMLPVYLATLVWLWRPGSPAERSIMKAAAAEGR